MTAIVFRPGDKFTIKINPRKTIFIFKSIEFDSNGKPTIHCTPAFYNINIKLTDISLSDIEHI